MTAIPKRWILLPNLNAAQIDKGNKRQYEGLANGLCEFEQRFGNIDLVFLPGQVVTESGGRTFLTKARGYLQSIFKRLQFCPSVVWIPGSGEYVLDSLLPFEQLNEIWDSPDGRARTALATSLRPFEEARDELCPGLKKLPAPNLPGDVTLERPDCLIVGINVVANALRVDKNNRPPSINPLQLMAIRSPAPKLTVVVTTDPVDSPPLADKLDDTPLLLISGPPREYDHSTFVDVPRIKRITTHPSARLTYVTGSIEHMVDRQVWEQDEEDPNKFSPSSGADSTLDSLREHRREALQMSQFPSTAILLGAGFSQNWGGFLVDDVWDRLMVDPDISDDLELNRLLLDQLNFELVLGHARSDATSRLLTAVSRVFATQAEILKKWQDDSKSGIDSKRVVNELLCRAGMVFTLNQDRLVEAMTGSFAPAQMRILGEELVSLGDDNVEISWHDTPLPRTDFRRDRKLVKLHGSTNWKGEDGKSLFVTGEKKIGSIASHWLLSWYHDVFARFCSQESECKLLVVGYGFGDEHINQLIRDGTKKYLKVWIWDVKRPTDLRSHLHNHVGGEIWRSLGGAPVSRRLKELFPATNDFGDSGAFVAQHLKRIFRE